MFVRCKCHNSQVQINRIILLQMDFNAVVLLCSIREFGVAAMCCRSRLECISSLHLFSSAAVQDCRILPYNQKTHWRRTWMISRASAIPVKPSWLERQGGKASWLPLNTLSNAFSDIFKVSSAHGWPCLTCSWAKPIACIYLNTWDAHFSCEIPTLKKCNRLSLPSPDSTSSTFHVHHTDWQI